MSAADRLARLLFIVPYAMHRDGVPVDELAALLDVTSREIVADVDLLCMVGRPPLTPDHLIDLYIEAGIVYVELDQSLSRPMRLTHEEARALVLGVKWVGDSGGGGPQLQSALDQLTQRLNEVDRQAVETLSRRICVTHHDAGRAAHGVNLRCAIQTRQGVEAIYYSASSDRKRTYRLKPLALVAHGAAEYVVALDVDAADKEKLFRLDRLQDVKIVGPAFAAQAIDLERFRTPRLYLGEDTFEARVRVGPRSWRRIAEHFEPQDIAAQDARGTLVRLATQSLSWLARWSLHFGLDAEIVAPAQARAHVAILCAEAEAVYAQAARPPSVAPKA